MRPWQTGSLSPFCIKLETYLRITQIPYKLGKFVRGDAPKGKIPYVRIDGKPMGDSQLVIEELERRLVAENKPALDEGLSPRDAALGRIARRAIEEGCYFHLLYLRWIDDDGFGAVRDEFKKLVPGFVASLIRRKVRTKLDGQGTGRHSRDEVMALGAADFDAIAELLGDRPYFLGDTPRVIDCTLYAFLEGVLGFPIDSPIKARVAARANLVAYRARIRERWWQDLDAA
ncbi:MAG TPA: glutathione S-transferase family protein [Kofleriaceae bacterium]|nr:glutathione S-transferase family protein [Kofleriaceae bacterium]